MWQGYTFPSAEMLSVVIPAPHCLHARKLHSEMSGDMVLISSHSPTSCMTRAKNLN